MKLTKYLLTEPLGTKHILLINCLSGAVDIMENKKYFLLKQSKINLLDKDTLNTLSERRYLFMNERDENKFIHDIESKYTIAPKSQLVDLIVCPTFDCNLSCSYCFQKNLDIKNVHLTNESTYMLSKAISEMEKYLNGEKAIQLFGGEPLLPKNRSVLDQILAYSQAKEYPVAITTNGTTILFHKRLIKKYANTIKLAQITIDGPPEIHDKRRVPKNGRPTFKTIIKGIKYLLENSIGVHTRINVDSTNVDYLPKLVKILKSEGLFENEGFRCYLAPVANHCDKNQSSSLLNEYELMKRIEKIEGSFSGLKVLSKNRIPKTLKHLQNVLQGTYSSPRFTYCQANGSGYFVFSPDGYIYPCSEAAGHKDLAIGKFFPNFILYERKMSLWNKRTILTLEKCRNCNIAPLCGGGCTYAAYGINKDINKPYCHNAKKVIRDYLKENKFDLFEKAKKQQHAV